MSIFITEANESGGKTRKFIPGMCIKNNFVRRCIVILMFIPLLIANLLSMAKETLMFVLWMVKETLNFMLWITISTNSTLFSSLALRWREPRQPDEQHLTEKETVQ